MSEIMSLEYLESSRKYIRSDLENIAKNFVKLGFHLYEVQYQKTYEHAGYESVAEFAEMEFGIKKSTCYNLIKLVQNFSKNGNSMFLDDAYEGYGYSQLVEMLSLPGKGAGVVKPDMSVAQIREIKKFGKPVDEDEQREEVLGIVDYLKRCKPDSVFTVDYLRKEIASRCRSWHYTSSPGIQFSPGIIKGRHYRYTPASLLDCIGKYAGFDEEGETSSAPVQTSGVGEVVEDVPAVEFHTFEERHNAVFDYSLSDKLLELLKNNIKNVDKVKAIIDYLNEYCDF